MFKIFMIALGGGLGTLLRYVLAGWAQKFVDGSFPLGTLVVNSAGCFLIGFLGAAFGGPFLIREEYRVALFVGVLGGFTTFSTFGWETFSLTNDGQFRLAVANAILTNAIGFAAVWVGYRMSHKLLGM